MLTSAFLPPNTSNTYNPQGLAHALQLAQLARKFGKTFVLKNIDLELKTGELMVLFGDNGSGKTTLLRVLAGLLSPSRGEGRVFGYDLRDRRSVREHTFLMAEGGLYADLSPLENLIFSSKMYGLSTTTTATTIATTSGIATQSIVERCHEALRVVKLEQATHKRTRELSSGMRKRLQFARMILSPSPLLLIDEPLANLDNSGKELVLEQLQHLHHEGRSILFTSHEPELARQIATQERELSNGILI